MDTRADATTAAVTVLLTVVPAVLLAAVLLTGAAGPGGAGPGAQAGIPRTMAGYSYLTGSVSLSPPGPAVALWHQGFGVELMDFPQALVLSAHDDSYRRVDVAERRGGTDTQGDPGPMLLSPDGTHVAVGDHAAGSADVALLDLSTGDVERFAVAGARSVMPVAWSSDGRKVAYLMGPVATNPYAATPPTGRPGVLDLTTGDARTWEGDARARTMAFSPDGSMLAVQWSRGMELVSVDGTVVPDQVPQQPGALAGPDAWSPDGELVAVSVGDGSLAFVDVTGGEPPDRLLPGLGLDDRVLGWTADREVVVPAASLPEDGGSGDLRVLRVDLDGGTPEPLTTLPSYGNFGVGRFQLASALLPDLLVRDPGDPDRGVWPLWASAVAAALLAWLARSVGRAGHTVARRSRQG